jgi:nucleoside 2-deoxyribosyltransferase
MKRVYLAGKVKGNKWVVAKKAKEGIKEVSFVASDGGNHSEHGLGFCYYSLDSSEDYKEAIKREFCDVIKKCDMVIAYIDTTNSFGSIAEIGYSSALGLPIHIIFPKSYREVLESPDSNEHSAKFTESVAFDTYWFCCSLPNVTVYFSESIDDAVRIVYKILGKVNYKEYLKTDHWATVRDEALERCNYRCQLCDKENTALNIHHNNYRNLYKETPSDVIALCSKCHEKFHSEARLN